jgi:L-lactate dehydrogenase complex protein LldG
VGVSQVECAIAATGTLVTDAAPVERRLASALPVIHVAIVPTDAIHPDMASALTQIHPSKSGYISMITGPSRTADIERVLTIGVHGPSRLVIVFVDELGRN